ncbi:MAG: hypothetical protein QOH47_821 [Sphingomonadales bacterium]|jgi:HK97 family phage portal protein|nr:hypothetical protein [Sphingomonadales bacterium]
MGGLFGTLTAGVEAKMTSRELEQVMGSVGRLSQAGAVVTWSSALAVTTVLDCCRVIADGCAQVPWRVHREMSGSRIAAVDHAAYDLLYRRPNGWQTSFEFRQTILFHVLLTGNAFVWKGMVGSARELRSLEPIEPGRMTVRREPDGRLRYFEQKQNGAPVEHDPATIWHLRGPSWNGWMGMEAVKLARDAIGLTMAIEAGQADSHRNGARISGLYSVQEKMGLEKFEQIDKWLERHTQGGDRAGKPIIGDMGAKFEPIQMTGVEAQTLEMRKHQVEEVCRVFRVMPIMVGQADKAATYASAEQMFLAHVVHTLMPWYENIQQSADVALLSDRDRAEGYYTKLNPNALMRGAATDRADYYAKALGTGGGRPWMKQNEVRGLEELDQADEVWADELGEAAMGPQAPDPNANADPNAGGA